MTINNLIHNSKQQFANKEWQILEIPTFIGCNINTRSNREIKAKRDYWVLSPEPFSINFNNYKTLKLMKIQKSTTDESWSTDWITVKRSTSQQTESPVKSQQVNRRSTTDEYESTDGSILCKVNKSTDDMNSASDETIFGHQTVQLYIRRNKIHRMKF